jgi:uncharacterized protein YjlB
MLGGVVIPNNPKLALVLYRNPIRLSGKFDPAAVFEELFERNGWGDSWRNGIYDYPHYHSRIHEVLGVARGHARVRFGGAKGRALKLKAGDVVIVPAGTGHERLSGSKDLMVVGAYPPSARTTSAAHRAKSMTLRARPFPRSRSPEKTRCTDGTVR